MKTSMLSSHRRMVLITGLTLAAAAWSGNARADGGFFYEQNMGNTAESPQQRALVIHDGRTETLMVQVKYDGNVEDFAWVVPIPRLPGPAGVTTVSDSIFLKLHELTQPKLFYSRGKSAYDEGSNEAVIPDSSVTVWSMLQVGPYSVSVVSGTNAQALTQWLEARGFASSEHQSTIEYYVNKGWFFLAMEVQVYTGSGNSEYQAGLPAIQVSFPAEQPVFPLCISRISSSPENEVEVYVISNHRMSCDSYSCDTVDETFFREAFKQYVDEKEAPSRFLGIACACDQITEPLYGSDFDYETLFRQDLASHPRPAFLVEAAIQGYTSYDPVQYPNLGTLDGFFNDYLPSDSEFWITRFRSILGPEDMMEDMTFVPYAGGDVWFQLYLQVPNSPTNPWLGAGMGLWLIIPWTLPRRHRKRIMRIWAGLWLLLLIL